MARHSDDFDPEDPLKGWSPRAPAEPLPPPPDLDLGRVIDSAAAAEGLAPRPDMTRVLDGWRPAERGAEPKRRRDMADVEDVPVVEIYARTPRPPKGAFEFIDVGMGASRAARDAAHTGGAEDVTFVETSVALRRDPNARVRTEWSPATWVGVMRHVHEATTEFVQTVHGPVVEAHGPQWLVALWPPASAPLPASRWPAQVALVEAAPDEAEGAVVALLPDGASVWLNPGLADWALLADIVLHHDAGLRPFQIQALRHFIDAEKLAAFDHLNDAYEWPVPGRPVRLRG